MWIFQPYNLPDVLTTTEKITCENYYIILLVKIELYTIHVLYFIVIVYFFILVQGQIEDF